MAKARIFNVLKVLLYCLGFPLFTVIALLNGLAITAKAPGYSFWPFVGGIVIAVLGIVYLVIGLIICRKKSKRTIMTQTVALALIGLIMTAGIGLVLDKVLPDIYPEGDTFYYKDAKYKWLAQSEVQGDVAKEFVRRNMLNGNLNVSLTEEYEASTLENIGVYDDEGMLRLDYAFMAETVKEISSGSRVYDALDEYKDKHEDDEGNETKTKAADYLNDYLATELDREQTALFETVRDQYVKFDSTVEAKNRDMVALNYVLCTSDVYNKLILECTSNKGVAKILEATFPSIDKDGYVTFDDCLLPYANSSRQSVGVLVHLVLDDRDTYSETNEPLNFLLFNTKTGELESAPVNWTILDMDGGEISVDLSSLMTPDMGGIINTVLNNILSKKALCDAINTLVADENVANSPLYLSIFNGEGYLEIVVRPANVARGVEGYQRTAWLDSNYLLLMLLSIISTRDLMSAFAAVIAVTTFLAGMCRIEVAEVMKKCGKSKKKKGKKDNAVVEVKSDAVQTAEVKDEVVAPEADAAEIVAVE